MPTSTAVHTPRVSVRLLLWGALSVLFTLVVIQYSLRHGRLVTHPTFDDVTYLADGRERLEILYQEGWTGLVAAQFNHSPHSPFATYLAALSFGVLGNGDWAPYAGNALIVFLLLLFVDHVFREADVRWRVGAAVLALSTPVAAISISEFRPDMACGLLTAMGVVLLLEVPLAAASARRLRAAGACFGFALFAKPTIAPLTVAMFGASLAIAVLADRVMRPPPRVRGLRRAVAEVIWPAAAVGLGPFLIDGPAYVRYFHLALFSPQKPIQDNPGTFLDQAAYYVVGVGGQTMLGAHVYLFAAVVVSAALLFRRGYSREIVPVALQVPSLFLAYVVPTLNPVKQHFFGVAFAFLLMLIALQVLAALQRIGHGAARPWANVVMAAAVIAGVACAKAPFYWGERGDPANFQREEVAEGVFRALRDLNHRPSAHVFVTFTGEINAQLLRYEALKAGAGNLRFSALSFEENTGDLRPYREWFNLANFALASESGNSYVFTGVPGGLMQDQVLALLRSLPDWIERATFPTPGGAAYVLFERIGAFYGWEPVSGFLPDEGPYPRWNLPLPRIRWATGPRSLLAVDKIGGDRRRLIAWARAIKPDLTMTISQEGKEIARHTFTKGYEFERIEVPLSVPADASPIELGYSDWDRSDENAQRAVLFRRLVILPDDSAPPVQSPRRSP